MKTKENMTLVLGGNGKTGSRVIQRLKTLGWPVRVGSRSAEIPFDWNDQATWKAVVQGIHGVYIAFHPDLAVPGAEKAIREFTKVAVENGAKKFVLLSGRGEKEAQACEQVVMKAGADWTIVRASWFNQNFSEGSFVDFIMTGHMALPADHVGEPFIDADDIADVAVAALTEEGHAGQLYEVTGPRLLTFREAVKEIENVVGRRITYETISLDQFVQVLKGADIPEEYVWLLKYLFTEVLDGRNAKLSDGVERALGRKPKDFSQYVREAASQGAWG